MKYKINVGFSKAIH